MRAVRLKIAKIHHAAQVPRLQTSGSAAADLHAAIDRDIELKPGDRIAVPTGLKVEVPEGYVLSVRPRSGMAIKDGVSLINSPGTIDSDFRGEVKVLLVNLSDKKVLIKNGDRIAQWLLEAVIPVEYVSVQENELTDTQRGGGGFGSTGKN